ncbi:MAG TPA: hypothetical protein VNM24_03655 [Burkholderiales bacterium]|jgi:hypothetical protein|nr:hypothetical protein [Burkholderiales bacterium]
MDGRKSRRLHWRAFTRWLVCALVGAAAIEAAGAGSDLEQQIERARLLRQLQEDAPERALLPAARLEPRALEAARAQASAAFRDGHWRAVLGAQVRARHFAQEAERAGVRAMQLRRARDALELQLKVHRQDLDHRLQRKR